MPLPPAPHGLLLLLLLLFLIRSFPWLCPPRMAGVPTLQMNWQQLHKRKGGPLGLRNLGNSCYLNSVLQCLTYTPPLANLCLLNQHSASCTSAGGSTNSICAFCLLEKRISRSLSIDAVSDTPSSVHNCLPLFAKHFRDGRQEDAHEFLRYVIDACNSVCVKLHKLLSVSKSVGKQGDSKGSKEEPHTVVKEIFGGVLQSQVKCLSCNAESNKMDEIMDLSLDIFHTSSLKEAMCRYFQPEVLDGSNKYRCEKCKKLTAARKQMSIFHAPNILVVQLKRFENIYGGKIDRFIYFEEQLELAGHMCRASQDPRPEYSLYGVIVHAGYSQESGHYYSYIKDANTRWFCCNDAHVSPVNSQAILAERAYILFYVRSNARPKVGKDRTSQNGHTQNPLATSRADHPKMQSSLSKENGLETRFNIENGMNSNTDKALTRPELRFNISRASNGQIRKPLNDILKTVRSAVNGHSGIDNSPTERHSNGLHKHSVDAVCSKKSEQKQHNELQSVESSQSFHKGTGEEIQVSGASDCDPSPNEALGKMSNSNMLTSDQRLTMSAKTGLNTLTSEKACDDSQGRNNFFLEEARRFKKHGNGPSMSSGHSIDTGCTAVLASQQQGSYQLASNQDRTGDNLERLRENHGESSLKEHEGLLGPKIGTKRIMPDICHFSTSITEKDIAGKQHTATELLTIPSAGKNIRTDVSQLENLKLLLVKEGREWLHQSGWCEMLRESLRAAKRRKVLKDSFSSNLEGQELRRELIGNVQESLRQQVPKELKEHFVEQLRAFFVTKSFQPETVEK